MKRTQLHRLSTHPDITIPPSSSANGSQESRGTRVADPAKRVNGHRVGEIQVDGDWAAVDRRLSSRPRLDLLDDVLNGRRQAFGHPHGLTCQCSKRGEQRNQHF